MRAITRVVAVSSGRALPPPTSGARLQQHHRKSRAGSMSSLAKGRELKASVARAAAEPTASAGNTPSAPGSAHRKSQSFDSVTASPAPSATPSRSSPAPASQGSSRQNTTPKAGPVAVPAPKPIERDFPASTGFVGVSRIPLSTADIYKDKSGLLRAIAAGVILVRLTGPAGHLTLTLTDGCVLKGKNGASADKNGASKGCAALEIMSTVTVDGSRCRLSGRVDVDTGKGQGTLSRLA